jgi:hypothetical protein
MENIVWISSAPRTGSMWTYNVCRELLKLGKRNVLPKILPKADGDMFSYYNKALRDKKVANYYCLKVHSCLTSDLHNSKIITTIRDPRQVTYSFQRFMKCDFESAFAAAATIHNYVLAYEKSKSPKLFLRYDDITNIPCDVVWKINKFLELNLSQNVIKRVSEKLSLASVKKIIDKSTIKLEKDMRSGANIKSDRIVQLSSQNYRAFDPSTGFQTGHIAEPSDGSWVTAYDDTQKDYLWKIFSGFCERHGYSR